jgi:beta-glucosidase
VGDARSSDVTFAVIGLSPLMEGEEGDAFLSKNGADKADLRLPAVNIAFMKKLRKESDKPIVAVVTSGSALDIAEIEPYADAIILAWYPGEQGGNAFADIAFGKVSPSGHLPVTFYKSLKDLPDYKDYNMKGRTYRYFKGDVEYPFGYGLSYTTFDYQWSAQPKTTYTEGQKVNFTVKVANTGKMDGDEVIQAYITYPNIDRMPVKELKQFKRVTVKKGDQQEVNIEIPLTDLEKWDLKQKKWKLYKGQYQVVLGSNSADKKLAASFTVK